MEKKTSTSSRLKEIMNERGYKQVDILKLAKPYCKKYNTPLNKNDLSQYVSGKIEPGQKKIMILAECLKVNPSWLMGLDVPKNDIYIKEFFEGKSELEIFTNILKKKGFLDENEELSEKNFNILIDFAKANKQFIMKDKDKE